MTKEEIIETLKELGPHELETVEKVILNMRWYDKFYATVTNFIFSKYPDIDMNKLEKISADIDQSLENLGRGEVLLIYNKLNEPFIRDFFNTYITPAKLGIVSDPLKEINTLILALNPDIKMKNIEKITKDIEEKVNTLNLTYGEKWLLFNWMSHIYLLDLIETAGV